MAGITETVLPQSVGYGVVVGLGFLFALVMSGISWLQNRYTNLSIKSSEEFNTASRSVKPALIASGIVSAWTWAATLLQSSTVAYEFGVAGPFWYAAGATIQILMFSIIACKTKLNAPRCHTWLEIIYARYGAATHGVFIFFALLTNILVASNLLLGGSAVVSSLTGMNVYAAIFLIPLGVCIYVVMGGLRATFLCDYSHTVILMVVILYFMFEVYATGPLIGSPSEMFELLSKAASSRPVTGNQEGSYMTMKSNSALVFGITNLCVGSGTVFLDQAYWQRAIASQPSTAVRAYILGGLAWFAIPFGFATTLGLAAVALTDNPSFPTYPNPMTSSQVSSGLAAPFAASTLLGTSGAVALLIVLFMAVTSCASAELIAVSSVLTFDIYKTYINPRATPERLIFVSHIMIGVAGFLMCIFAVIWNAVGVDLGWLFVVMGLLIGGAVFPAAFSITWKKQTSTAAIAGSVSGFVAGITAWLVEAKVYYGEITIATTGEQYPTMAGNLAAIMTGLIVSIAVTYMKPDDFDWEITRAINKKSASTTGGGVQHDLIEGSSPADIQTDKIEEKLASDKKSAASQQPEDSKTTSSGIQESIPETSDHEDAEAAKDRAMDESPSALKSAFKVACIASFVLPFIMDFLIPIPMFLSEYVFSKGFFTAWIVITFMWVFCSTGISVVLPIIEAWSFFTRIGSQIKKDIGI